MNIMHIRKISTLSRNVFIIIKIMRTYDFVVVGGGILGLSLSRALRMRYPTRRVALLEKESEIGVHASGRSGGVLHAGFYHADDPAKIRLTKRGNVLLTKFCMDHNLPLNRCGQLVVTGKAQDLAGLEILRKRAEVGEIRVDMLNERQTSGIDQNVRTVGHSLYCPSVSTMEPKRICQAMAEEVQQLGVDLLFSTKYMGRTGDGTGIKTSMGEIVYGKLFNTAGVYADRVAHDFGIAPEFRMIPFTIAFMKTIQPSNAIRTNVFTVPNFDFPYLEVKMSPMPDGKVKVGPVATPAFWRESEMGLRRFSIKDFVESAIDDLRLVSQYNTTKLDYRVMALQEYRKRIKRFLRREANKQLKEKMRESFEWDKPGVIANLFDTKKKLYIEDLLVVEAENSCHVLNIVFPGFTCAMPIAEDLVNQYTK